MKVKVSVIFGGCGAEHDISVLSAQNFIKNIDTAACEILPVYITKEGRWLLVDKDFLYSGNINAHCVETFPVYIGGVSGFLCGAGVIGTDFALPLLHGDFGEDGVVQGALVNAKIRLIGPSLIGGAIASDKVLTKDIATALGIPTLPYVPVQYGESDTDKRIRDTVGYPCIIKPSGLGSSHGISVCLQCADLPGALEYANSASGRIIVEEYLLNKRELECAYLNLGQGEVISFGEVMCDAALYDYYEKYKSDSAKTEINVNIDLQISDKIKKYTRLLAKELGLVMCRCDYFVRDGKVYLNEINTTPGFTKKSLYPLLLNKEGITLTKMLTSLIEVAK